jgi:FkbM family methyltransferase
MKNLLKKIIHVFPWPLTLSERYDRQTKAIIRKVCTPDSVCIDVGCFKGDILQLMVTAAPKARHIAFEPTPVQYEYLKNKFSTLADIYPFALSNENGRSSFHYVRSNPTYSGLLQRKYVQEEEIEEIQVEVRRLDDVVAPDMPVRLIKIDVEGGEYNVMRGAEQLLRSKHPYIIFEHGLGATDKYGFGPEDVYEFLVTKLGYRIMLMSDFLKNVKQAGFSKDELSAQFHRELNCYFIAVP